MTDRGHPLSPDLGNGAEQEAEASTPSGSGRAVGTDTGRTCKRCRTPAEGDENSCQNCGSFLPGNEAAMVHGGRRFELARSPMDEARRIALRDAVVADLGGEDAVSEVMAALVEDFAFAVVLRDLLAAHLMAVGPLTNRNQKRAAVDAWHRASARAERLATKLGLERKATELPSLTEVIEKRAGDRRGPSASVGERSCPPGGKATGQGTPGSPPKGESRTEVIVEPETGAE